MLVVSIFALQDDQKMAVAAFSRRKALRD